MPTRSSRAVTTRYPRSKARRRHRSRWPWVIVAALLALALYVTWSEQLSAPAPIRVGIVAGHWQYDSGAVCPDGLREVDITVAVARLVVQRLTALGYEAEVLGAFADRLNGYRAAALVSLHADSCIYELSGFKIAGPTDGPSAHQSALLVESLKQSYAAATGLGFHEHTITPAMTHYHAFRRIHPDTPAAIVELGFMGGDRHLLVNQQERVASGVVEGLLAYLSVRAEAQQAPTPKR